MAITITRSSTYLTKPVITVYPDPPVLGRRFTLFCDSGVEGVTYSWKKSGTEIAREFEQLIQIDNATTSDVEMVYVCTAKMSMITQTSDSFTFSFVATISSTAVNGEVYTVDETITLKCVTTPDASFIDSTTKAVTYVWTNNAQPLSGATSQTYDIPKTEGVFLIKCQATYTASVQSAAITITRNSTYLTKPVIKADPTTPVLGSKFTLACGSAVDGATYSWKKNGTEIARKLEQIIQIDNAATSDAGVYECTAKRSKVIQTSDSFTVSFNFDITAATISSTAVNGEVYTVNETITLKCVPTPDVPYIDTTSKAVTYVWMNNVQPLSGATSQTYDIPKTEGVFLIKCQATYTASVQSAAITITRNSTYLTKPVIKADPTTPVLGSKFTLACGSAVDGATYSWKKNGTEIARQSEQIIQIDNATISDAGLYECTAKRSKVIQTSDSFTVSFNSAPEIVKISMLVLGLTLLMSKVFA